MDAAWEEFQNEYQGQAAAFDRTIQCEAESSDHQKTSSAQVARKRTRVFRYVLVAAVLIVLLCGTASGFGRIFQAMVNWTAETFGFESPYGVEASAEAAEREDPYINLRTAVAEYTDLPVVPKWAPEGTVASVEGGVQKTTRKDSTQLSGIHETTHGRYVVRIMVHNEIPVQYTGAYQWNEAQVPVNHKAGGLNHELVYNHENSIAAWTSENVECVIQGALSEEELEKMIDSIYEE